MKSRLYLRIIFFQPEERGFIESRYLNIAFSKAQRLADYINFKKIEVDAEEKDGCHYLKFKNYDDYLKVKTITEFLTLRKPRKEIKA